MPITHPMPVVQVIVAALLKGRSEHLDEMTSSRRRRILVSVCYKLPPTSLRAQISLIWMVADDDEMD
jgi:hypothetical protein